MFRLQRAERIEARENSLGYVRYLNDFLVSSLHNNWTDTSIAGRVDGKKYVVKTNPKVIERCMHMVTDPGDLLRRHASCSLIVPMG